MAEIKVEIDTAFIRGALEYMDRPSEGKLARLMGLKATRGVHAHAMRFGNTDESREGFWKAILTQEVRRGAEHFERMRRNIDFIASRGAEFEQAFDEVGAYLPGDLSLKCRLHLILGYDIGIVSEGDAYLNVGHAHFGSDRRELLYFAMHEVHHAGYTRYHPIYSLAGLRTPSDLRGAVLYSTHLEGTAVYSSYERRAREGGLGHVDYRILNDPRERKRVTREFFRIMGEMGDTTIRPLEEAEFDVLERMSGGDRLWYVTGAHMAQEIDESLGRKALNRTIVDGPGSFFDAYKACKAKK